jgi:hypothetical protein
VTHRVNPAVKGMKAPGAESAIDRISAQPELHELSSADDAVLAVGECRDLVVRVKFAAHIAA